MGERISSYKELRVFENAMNAAMKIFEHTKAFPPEKNTQWSIRCAVRPVLCVPI